MEFRYIFVLVCDGCVIIVFPVALSLSHGLSTHSATDMVSVLKVVMPKMKKMATNPLSAMFEGEYNVRGNCGRLGGVCINNN